MPSPVCAETRNSSIPGVHRFTCAHRRCSARLRRSSSCSGRPSYASPNRSRSKPILRRSAFVARHTQQWVDSTHPPLHSEWPHPVSRRDRFAADTGQRLPHGLDPTARQALWTLVARGGCGSGMMTAISQPVEWLNSSDLLPSTAYRPSCIAAHNIPRVHSSTYHGRRSRPAFASPTNHARQRLAVHRNRCA